MRTQFLLLSAAAGALAKPCKAPSKESSLTGATATASASGSGASTTPIATSISFPTGSVSAPGSIPSDTVPGYGGGEGVKPSLTTPVATSVSFPTGSVSGLSSDVVFSTSISASIPGSTGGSGGFGMSVSMSAGAGAQPTGTAGLGGSGSTGGDGGMGMSVSVGTGATPTGAGNAQTTGGLTIGGGLGGNSGLGSGAGGSSGTCSAPTIAGGLFDILGGLSANAGMSFSTKAGSGCSAGVFAGAKVKRTTVGSLTGAANGAIGAGESLVNGALSAGASILNGATGGASAALSGSAGLLTGIAGGVEGTVASDVDAGLSAIFAGSNFLQIGGEVAGALGSLCQTVPLCKGKKYTLSVDCAAGVGGDIDMLFQIGGMAGLKSPVKSLSGGMSAKASMSFDFTWDQADLLTVPLCLLATIAHEGQALGLANLSIAAKV